MSTRTRQRDTIRQVFIDEGRPLSPAEIHQLAGETLPDLGMATVYRTIRLLMAEEFLAVVALPGEPDRYELAHPAAGHHHHHFQCRSCDRVFDLSGCLPNLKSLLPEGFSMSDHEIFLFGKCAECNA